MRKALKKILLSIGFSSHQLYSMKQNFKSYLFQMRSNSKSIHGNNEINEIAIANKSIPLHMTWLHEKEYYQNHINGIKDVDFLIAEKLVNPEDVVLDVGANIGITALHYLQLGASEVHAFEPVPQIYNRLETLRDDKLCTYPFALSNKTGKDLIFISKTHNQGNTLSREVIETHPAVFGDKLDKTLIDITTLDTVLPGKKFDYIKVDIENHEIQFIEGGLHLFMEYPPRVLQIEIYDKTFESTHQILIKYFKFARKVIYNLNTEQIKFVDITRNYDEYLAKGFKINPPNYIYYNDESIIEN